ncbi:hypothetical protein GCM10009809_25030 [Isoptericola hypogeus]|uniref:Uncharacterized protein n=1 Tax=Isoptericola hypogeus TaxID=300179 RepID=A0ABP4VMM2_9MICO
MTRTTDARTTHARRTATTATPDARTTGRPAGRGPGRPGGFFRRPTPAWAVPLVAAVVAAVVWAVSRTSGIELVVRVGTGTRTVGLVDVVVAALVVGLVGWGVRALLRRLPGGGGRAWLVLCAVVLLVSLAGPVGAAGTAVMGLLVAEHVAVGATVALGLRR